MLIEIREPVKLDESQERAKQAIGKIAAFR